MFVGSVGTLDRDGARLSDREEEDTVAESCGEVLRTARFLRHGELSSVGPGRNARPSSVGTAGTSTEATSKTLKELSAPKSPMTYGAGYLAKLRREAPQKVRNPFVPATAASGPLCPSHAHSGSQPLTCLKRRTFREPHSSVRKAPLQGLGIESEARPRQYDWRTLQLTTTGLRVTLPESAGSRD
jgi:hypothetical protein